MTRIASMHNHRVHECLVSCNNLLHMISKNEPRYLTIIFPYGTKHVSIYIGTCMLKLSVSPLHIEDTNTGK